MSKEKKKKKPVKYIENFGIHGYSLPSKLKSNKMKQLFTQMRKNKLREEKEN
jgi:hypothetical protein